MNNVRSRLPSALVAAAFAALSAQTALAQVPPAATIVRTVLVVTSLPSVVDVPVFFKLSKIELAAGQTAKYSGSVGFLYVLSGAIAMQTDAGQRSLQPDDAFLVTAGSTHLLNASGSQLAQFLHFVLARSSELDQPPNSRPRWWASSIVRRAPFRISSRVVMSSR
jgi:mannose-6-phosphate isomerase-like protein (cupin superfamily)